MLNETNPPERRGRDSRRRQDQSGRGRGRKTRPRPEVSQQAPAGERLALVQFKGHRKGYYHTQNLKDLRVGQYCLVEADRGRDMGRITYLGPGNKDWWTAARRQGVLLVATESDLVRLHNNRGDEWEFWDICQEKITARKLKMNLVSVERQFDHKKITFFFTADKRVDFRELVRDLASVFRTRIELRQIGVRDEARLKGGLGICGREFCCSSFLHEFVPVTLRMAKVQQLPLNPGKLSGPCGRLRCCLTFEQELYQENQRRLPRVGARVSTPDGKGTVRKLDLIRSLVLVSVVGMENATEYSAEDLSWEVKRDLPSPKPSSGCSGDGCGKKGDGRGD